MNALTERFFNVFHWPVAHPIRLLLPGMVLVSLLAHLLLAYGVKVSAPSRPGLTPWPSKVTILPRADEGAIDLLEVRDPSWLEPGRFRDRMLPPPKPVRRDSALRPELPALVSAPRETMTNAWVPSLPPVAARPLFVQQSSQAVAPILLPASARLESGEAWITDDVISRLRAVAPPEPPGRATELLVMLAPSGDTRNVWLVRGSGNAELDLAAQLAVQRARFAPGTTIRRDVLRISWGARGTAP